VRARLCCVSREVTPVSPHRRCNAEDDEDDEEELAGGAFDAPIAGVGGGAEPSTPAGLDPFHLGGERSDGGASDGGGERKTESPVLSASDLRASHRRRRHRSRERSSRAVGAPPSAHALARRVAPVMAPLLTQRRRPGS
jgi:hypothetical protein